ncbi:DUF309 domain-containing protein [Isosphaeraceae bacterium EP7]
MTNRSGIDEEPGGVDEGFPAYTYIPSRGLPHPRSSPLGHSRNVPGPVARPIVADRWNDSPNFMRACRLFNAGYYWEAHEEWEANWHAQGRTGPVAEVVKGLIKLAAAGVKVREGRPIGVASHARRAADSFRDARVAVGPTLLGLDLDRLELLARDLADHPIADEPGRDGLARPVFQFRIEPGSLARQPGEK